MKLGIHPYALLFCLLSSLSVSGLAQSNSTLRGTITLGNSGKTVHNVRVTIIQLKRSVDTDEKGSYEFQNVPPGNYDVAAHLDLTPDVVKKIQVTAGAAATADFQLELSSVSEQVTVTATGSEETLFNSIQSVTVIGSLDLAKRTPSL